MKKCLLILSLLLFNPCYAQDQDSGRHNPDLYRLSLISAATTAGVIAGITSQENMWWKGERSAFYINNNQDWTYALGSDKFGHFYFSYLVSDIYGDLFKWAGIDEPRNKYYAAGLAFCYQTYTEIRDGFSKDYGFSPGDFTANLIGASWPILSHRYAFLDYFVFKISYHPSERFRNNSNRYIIDDYESTYNWVSFRINNILPDQIEKYYPDFLMLTIGHNVAGLATENPHHILFAGFDIDFEAIPVNLGIFNPVKKLLNYYKIPLPLLQFSPGLKFYLFRY
ncbi:MAG: YfiM family protein [Ignavibacteriales bacterium]|nr:YfiM family protein [Ignavibacteriales bacterium]MCF8304969.1 YfiM family protein [Ignavibacteriales bacterium]MCF8314658.1 YfiM family protein [Ignavibacteriales bacterium]MCF8436305.1 YfiM family protein [Ignavibacteriales bacterium]